MPCYEPRSIHYHPTEKTVNGGKLLVWNARDADALIPINIACGQCVGCRLERSRQWAVRCMHEAQLYDENCFVTLTYDDDHLPEAGLEHEHWQKFFKRLRQKIRRETLNECKVHGFTRSQTRQALKHASPRFYMCGEYGEQFGRPHFHACIFNYDFPDKKLFKKNRGHPIFTSKILESLWPYGYSSVAGLSFQSAAYVARYIMKKQTGDAAADHYEILNEYGEYVPIRPEYNKMSLKPGIGADWLKKFSSDVYPHDFVVVNEKKSRPPKYYDKLFEVSYPSDLEDVKFRRLQAAKKYQDNNTPERLGARLKVQLAKLAHLKRTLR